MFCVLCLFVICLVCFIRWLCLRSLCWFGMVCLSCLLVCFVFVECLWLVAAVGYGLIWLLWRFGVLVGGDCRVRLIAFTLVLLVWWFAVAAGFALGCCLRCLRGWCYCGEVGCLSDVAC